MVLALAALLGSCAEDDPATSNAEDELVDTAASLRELPFLRRPRIERRDPLEYAEATARSARAIADRELEREHAVWGRLGYFPRTFDLRASGFHASVGVAGYYTTEHQVLVLLDPSDRPIVVHELVHALQDQHFDLDAFHGGMDLTTDERFARAAVVEGDARICQLRYAFRGRNDTMDTLALAIAPARGVATSETGLVGAAPSLPAAYQTFTYNYGTAAVGRAAGVFDTPPAWRRAPVDALFHDTVPKTTEDVIRGALGRELDAIVDVGIAQLPDALAGRYEIDRVDRIGAWHTYLLLRTDARADELRELALAWDGDQLVTLRPQTLERRSELPLPVGLVWTTAWDDATKASLVVTELIRVHAAEATAASTFRAADGEMMWLEQRDTRVVFIKGLPVEDMRTLVGAALGPP